jgi:hypothetical protein
MNKSKISISKIGKYFREVSVVVLGVAITLFATIWINNKSEKRDLALYLNAIKIELEENIQILEAETEYYEELYKYAVYLRSHDEKSLHPDSLMNYYNSNIGEVHNLIFQTGAFDMFKTSGVMRLMNANDLVQTIWKAYLTLDYTILDFNLYYQLKTEDIRKEDEFFRENGHWPKIPLRNSLIVLHNYGRLKACKNTLEFLRETVSKIEKQK